MAKLPKAPPEPARNNDVTQLAPHFQQLLAKVIASANAALAAHGYHYRFGVFEGLRTLARQRWLYGSGRTYAGGWLTNASTNLTSWHGFGLAADVVPRTLLATGALGDWTWDVPAGAWTILYEAAVANACTTGLHWHSQDDDHVQPANLKVSPSDTARSLMASGGLESVWRATGHAAPDVLSVSQGRV